MTIYGVSQSSGVQRRLKVERGGQGIVLIITDHVGDKELQRILVQGDNLLPIIMEPPPGGATVEGISPPHGPKMLLDVEVRRNEVWIKARPEAGEGADVAVGLDDFQDALEGGLRRGEVRLHLTQVLERSFSKLLFGDEQTPITPDPSRGRIYSRTCKQEFARRACPNGSLGTRD